MKRIQASILSGALLATTALAAGCTSETTTGVDTETTQNEVDGRLNDEDGGAVTNENISPLDTSQNTTGTTTGTTAATTAGSTGVTTGTTTGGTTGSTTGGGTTGAN